MRLACDQIFSTTLLVSDSGRRLFFRSPLPAILDLSYSTSKCRIHEFSIAMTEKLPSLSFGINFDSDDDDDDSLTSNVEELVSSTVAKLTADKSAESRISRQFKKLERDLKSSGVVKAARLDKDAPSSSFLSNGSSSTQSLSAAISTRKSASSSSSSSDALKRKSLGKGWFDMVPAELTSELKRDINVIKMRNYLDPKKFYKKPDKMRNILHVGTVIEGSGDSKSARLTKKERRQTLVEEVLADKTLKGYSKRTYDGIQAKKKDKIKAYKKSGSKGKGKKSSSGKKYF